MMAVCRWLVTKTMMRCVSIVIMVAFGLTVYYYELVSYSSIFDDLEILYNYKYNFDSWNMPLELFEPNDSTLKFNKSIISPLFTRIIDNKYAIFCSHMYKPQGTGNALSIYWIARATAFFMNWTFVMNSNNNKITKGMDTSCRATLEYKMFDKIRYPRMKWTWFLEMEYNATFDNMYIDRSIINGTVNKTLISLKYNYLWQHYANINGKYAYNVPYWSYLMFLNYNPWIAQIIQHDTKTAFKKYYLYNASTSSPICNGYYWIDKTHTNRNFYESLMNDLNNKSQHIIIIHIRCGDLLLHGYRFFMNMQYFKNSLDLIFQYIRKHDNFDKFYRLRIISQLTKNNAHTDKDVKALNISNKMVYFMSEQIEKYIASKYNLNFTFDVIGNDTADNDIFEMITTRYLICSPSSFCLYSSIANYYDPKLIILPQMGAWTKQIRTYMEIAKNAKFGVLSHHKWINTNGMHMRVEKLFDTTKPSEENLTRFKQWFVAQ